MRLVLIPARERVFHAVLFGGQRLRQGQSVAHIQRKRVVLRAYDGTSVAEAVKEAYRIFAHYHEIDVHIRLYREGKPQIVAAFVDVNELARVRFVEPEFLGQHVDRRARFKRNVSVRFVEHPSLYVRGIVVVILALENVYVEIIALVEVGIVVRAVLRVVATENFAFVLVEVIEVDNRVIGIYFLIEVGRVFFVVGFRRD